MATRNRAAAPTHDAQLGPMDSLRGQYGPASAEPVSVDCTRNVWGHSVRTQVRELAKESADESGQGAASTVGTSVWAELDTGATPREDLLILGDNLPALHRLGRVAPRSVRCAYLDPPYNNRESYRHFSDDRSHDEWLKLIVERLTAIKPLLTDDGSVWISIDDREAHYLKVAADGVFGRDNFLTTIVWQQRTTRENRRAFSVNHEYILVYAADPKAFREGRNRLAPSAELLSRYRNPDNDPRGPWQSVSVNAQDGHATSAQYYELAAPNGRSYSLPKGRAWIFTRQRMEEEIRAGNIWFGKSGQGVPRRKRLLSMSKPGLTPETIWTASEVGTTDEAKKQLLAKFPRELLFDTPKPERLIARVIEIATRPGDLVLDPYLGSGTTAVVASRLGRRFVGIESNSAAMRLSRSRLGLPPGWVKGRGAPLTGSGVIRHPGAGRVSP